jgi:hypothetical protein
MTEPTEDEPVRRVHRGLLGIPGFGPVLPQPAAPDEEPDGEPDSETDSETDSEPEAQ